MVRMTDYYTVLFDNVPPSSIS